MTRNLLPALGLCSVSVLVPACSSTPETEVEPTVEVEVSQRKRRMLLATENAVHALLGRATEELDEVNREFERELDAIHTGPMLSVIDDVLEEYAREERDRFSRQVIDLEERTVTRLEAILELYRHRLWTVASEAGKVEGAKNLDFRSGYRELDEKVEATIVQLERVANVVGAEQTATLRAHDAVVLHREGKFELDAGQLLHFRSNPDLMDPSDHSPVSICFALIQPDLDNEIPVRFVQAVNHRIERDGIVVREKPWRFDPGIPSKEGLLPLRREIRAPGYVATDLLTPQVNLQFPGSQVLSDFVLVAEYRTALQHAETEEILATIAWQIRWAVDYRGRGQVVDARRHAPRLMEEDPVLPALLREPDADSWLEEFADD